MVFGEGPAQGKAVPSLAPPHPTTTRCCSTQSKLPCEVAYKALATARIQDQVTYDLQVYFPLPRDARRTRAPASLGRPSGRDTLRASGEARAACLKDRRRQSTILGRNPTTDKHLHKPIRRRGLRPFAARVLQPPSINSQS